MTFVEPGENGDEALKNCGTQSEEMKFALAADLNETGGFEFSDVVRERGCTDGKSYAGFGATQGAGGLGDAFKQFESSWIGESFENGGAAGGG